MLAPLSIEGRKQEKESEITRIKGGGKNIFLEKAVFAMEHSLGPLLPTLNGVEKVGPPAKAGKWEPGEAVGGPAIETTSGRGPLLACGLKFSAN